MYSYFYGPKIKSIQIHGDIDISQKVFGWYFQTINGLS